MCVDSRRLGENGADRGSGLGPCTVHVSFRPEEALVSNVVPAVSREDDSSSKYADPEADGVKPVFRTTAFSQVSQNAHRSSRPMCIGKIQQYLQIFLSSFGPLVRPLLFPLL